jgi:outer membrane biosynthesis protein TonB
MYICRVPGLGKFMVKLKESGITITEARSLAKEHPTWQQFEEAFAALSQRANSQEPEKAWEEIYGGEYPKEEPKKEVKEQKIPEKPQKTEKKKESKVKVAKNAKKDKPKTAAAVKHEETDGRVPESETAEERQVDDIQPEGSRGTDSTSGEADIGGTEGEPLSSGTGETLPGESTGASGGEGVAGTTSERNKYSARLENLIYQSKMLEKEISEYKDYQGATKTAKNIEQCIHAIIADLEKEEPRWKEVKE